MQGKNILVHENDYRGKMADRKMMGRKDKDSRIETNIVGVTSVPKLLAENNIQPVGGTEGDGNSDS